VIKLGISTKKFIDKTGNDKEKKEVVEERSESNRVEESNERGKN
jgi:hypothetical protein